MIVKVSRKWRISHDENNWIIQQRNWGHKPPNDWTNKYYFQDLANVFTTLVDMGVKDDKLTDFRGVLDRQREIYALIRQSIQDLAKQGGHKPPETLKKTKLQARRKKASKKPKGRASAKKGKKTKVK